MEDLMHSLLPLMIRTDRCHRMIIEGHVRRLGVHRTQHMILMYLDSCGKPPVQADIARAFRISSAAVAVTVRKMEQAGLIERRGRKENIRANEILLTEKGRLMAERTKELFREVDETAVRGIPEEELARFRACLARISENLENYRTETEYCSPVCEDRGKDNGFEEMV